MRQNFKLLFIVILLCFIVLEIGFRLSGKHNVYGSANSLNYFLPFETGNMGWAHTAEPFYEKKDVKQEFTTRWKANNEGLNEKNISLKKQGKRVLILGDSFTEGVGACNDSSYPRLLEKLLQQNSDSTIEIINAGVAGADVFTEYKLLTEKILKYEPDYIVLTINSTDYWEFAVRGGFERFIGHNELQFRPSPWYSFFYGHSFLIRRIIHDGLHYNYQFLSPQMEKQMDSIADKTMAQAIDSFRVLCTVHQINFAVVFQPLRNEIIAPETYKLNPLIAFCKERSIPYTDERYYLLQNHIDAVSCKKIYWQFDSHFNASGYQLLANSAFELFKKQKWLIDKSNQLPEHKN